VVLVRHGQTKWSAAGRHTGRTDVPLDATGRRQAEQLGERLGGGRFALVLTSPLSRARDTCALAHLGATAATDPDLEEWDYGEYEGITTPQIRASRPGWDLWTDGCPGGEAPADVARRVDRVLARLAAADLDGPALLFAHGHVLRVLAARWLGLEASAGALLALDPATVSRLGWEHERPVVTVWNAP
jgi:probable phosphoglycerate mutase